MQVTIDLDRVLSHMDEGRQTPEYLVHALRQQTTLISCDRLADEIEKQLPKPKPEEPTGLGAVVEDAKGVRWVRIGELGMPGQDDWKYAGITRSFKNDWQVYSKIDAVKVLSEGVTL